MDSIIKIINILQIIASATGLIWAFVGVMEFFGGRNHNDSMRQEKGANAMINGAGLGIISSSILQAIIALLNSMSGV